VIFLSVTSVTEIQAKTLHYEPFWRLDLGKTGLSPPESPDSESFWPDSGLFSGLALELASRM
jgi:hypothetical protein